MTVRIYIFVTLWDLAMCVCVCARALHIALLTGWIIVCCCCCRPCPHYFLLRRLSALYAVHFAYVDLVDVIYCRSLLLGALFHVSALHNFLLTDSPHIWHIIWAICSIPLADDSQTTNTTKTRCHFYYLVIISQSLPSFPPPLCYGYKLIIKYLCMAVD